MFIVEEDYIFDDEIAEEIGLKRGFTIKEGEYLLERFEGLDSYYVRF